MKPEKMLEGQTVFDIHVQITDPTISLPAKMWLVVLDFLRVLVAYEIDGSRYSRAFSMT